MPELTDAEILEHLRNVEAEAALHGAVDVRFPGLNPDIGMVRARPSAEERLQSFKDVNAAPGVPLDVKAGPPTMDMMWASFRKDPEQVVKYWQDKYGQQNVRLSTSGTPIVRVLNEETGQPEDILVNPEKITAKDLSKLVGQVPEIGMAIVADKGLGLLPKLRDAAGIWKAGRQATAQAVGAEAGGVLKDVAVRSMDSMPITSDVLATRAAAIPGDIAGNLALAGAGKLVSKTISPFGGELPAVQEDLKAAQEYWRSRGVNIPYSSGERTGSGFLQRSEEEMKRLPGGASGLRDIREQQTGAFRRIQNILVGLPEDASVADRAAVPTAEQTGSEAITALQAASDPREVGFQAARNRAVTEGNKAILDDMTAATTPTRQLYATKVGEAIRNKVQAELGSFQSQSKVLYEGAYSLPGGTDRTLAAPTLPKAAAKALKGLPGEDVLTSTPTGVIDPATGAPILRTSTGREVWKEFVPSSVIDKLTRLSESGGKPVSLRDLVAMRNEVTNDIRVGEAVPGVQTHHLGKIRDMLTDAIEEATDALPDKRLKNAWQTANDFYRDNVQKFHSHGIATILKDAEAPGSVGNAEIVSRLTAGSDRATDNFLDMKKFLGAASPEFQMLKRSIADSVYEGSLEVGKDTIDAKAFMGKLENLRSNQREIFDDVYGPKGHTLLLRAKQLGLAASDKLSAEEMERVLNDPASPVNLRQVVLAQRDRDELYRNSILKAVGSKTLPQQVNAGEFINRFVNSANPSEIRQAMGLIVNADPALAQRIRFKVMEDLLNESARNPLPQDTVAFRLDPNRTISSFKLEKLLNIPERQKVLTEVLGASGIDDLQNLARATRPIEAKQAAFASAGGIAGGMQVNRFWQGGILGFVDKSLRNTVGAAVLSFPLTRAYVGNTAMTPARTAQLMTLAVTSRPFVQELIHDFGEKGAMQAADKIKQGIGQYLASQSQTNQPAPVQAQSPTNNAAILNRLRQLAQP